MRIQKKIGLILLVFGIAFSSCKKEKNNSQNQNPIEVGKNYQGGVIFYVDGSGNHGLVAASDDQHAGISWYNSHYLATNALGLGVGTGASNTSTIVAAQGGGAYAAAVCNDLNLNGYSDWFLPSKEEFALLYQQRAAVGGFADDYYWTSTEQDSLNSWYIYFPYGVQYYQTKDIKARVRAVRAF